jgi:hypothetical protein
MKDRAVKERGPSVFNDIWSLLERGYEQVGFKVAGKSYLIVASHEERPLVRAELLAAKNEANRGIVVNEDDEEAFLGYYLDQEGNCCGDNKPQSWRAAPETLARKVVLAARLHSVRLADENRALKMAQANSSRKKRLAKRVTSASGGSDFSPELLRAIFDERKTELITIEIRGKEYLINARYHDHSIVKAELLATTEDEDTGIVLRDKHQDIFIGNFVDEEGHEHHDKLEPQTLSGAPEVLARKIVKAAELHRVRTTPVTAQE